MAGLVPAIHAVLTRVSLAMFRNSDIAVAWMPGTKPGMTR
jgi:hypothetical protein